MKKRMVVYGTLMEGYGNNTLLRGATLIGPVVVEGYELYYSNYRSPHSFGFPVAHAKEGATLEGEIWELPEGPEGKRMLEALDRLEGEPIMYKRTPIQDEYEMYVGTEKCWDFHNMEKCPKNAEGNQFWSRGLV